MKARALSLALSAACAPAAADEHLPVPAAEQAPRWEDLPSPVAGCTVQRLVMDEPQALFDWTPCTGRGGCSEAVWREGLIGEDGEIGRRTSVDDDGRIVRVAVRYDSDVAAQAGVILAREDGTIELGLRTSTAGSCNLNVPAVAHGRFGVLVTNTSEPLREGGLLAPLADLTALAAFELDPLPPGGGPDEAAMGASRWLWRFAPDRLATFSNVDGTNARVFAEQSSSILALGGPTSTGDSFVFEMAERAVDGTVWGSIGRSDGVAEPTSFIAGTPDAWVGAPLFAHSHLAWQRGISPRRGGAFDRVELWTSPATDDPDMLAPSKVGDLPGHGWSSTCAGWGRYVTAGTSADELLAWDLDARRVTSIVLPDQHTFASCPGVTRTAMWVVPELRSSQRRGLLRFAL